MMMDKQEVFFIFAVSIAFLLFCHNSSYHSFFVEWNQRLESVYFNLFTFRHLFLGNISSYIPLLHQNIISWVPIIAHIRFSVLDLFGSILSCRLYRNTVKSEKSWIECLAACTLLQFGGTTLTGLLLGQTPSWIMSWAAFSSLLLAWWLTFFCPYDIYWKTIHRVPWLIHIVGIGAAISSGHAITSWGVDKAYFNAFHVNSKVYPTSYLINIFCGVLSASGGGLLFDWLAMAEPYPRSFALWRSPSIFQPGSYIASPVINRSFILATLYFILIRYDHINYQGDVFQVRLSYRWLITSCQILNYLTLSMWPCVDVYAMISSILLRCCLITPTIHAPHSCTISKKST